MISLNVDEAKYYELLEKNIKFPVIAEFIADEITPISIFNSLEGKIKFILESATDGKNRGRYTFLGENPKKVFISDRSSYQKLNFIEDMEEVIKNNDILATLKKELKREYTLNNTEIPFTGGAIGYIGYDSVDYIIKNKKEIDIPESCMMEYKDIIVYDHFKNVVSIIINIDVRDKKKSFCELKDLFKEKYQSILNTASQKSEIHMQEENFMEDSYECEKEFLKKVEKAKEYINKGNIRQVVLSNRFKKNTEKNPFEIYRMLRVKNPSPYMFYLDYDDFQVIGSSPEGLVKVRNKLVEVNPIAGTRKRGNSIDEDLELEKELLKDKKELSEHLMLLDLGRKDMEKISKESSIKINSFKKIERYSHVMHMVSKISGTLLEDKDCFDALKSCFPAGTVSGFPRDEAIKIIDELEDIRREIYAGAVGYFGYNGDMDFCIAIRTIILKNKVAYVQSGAGIVRDSVPEREYKETLDKAKVLMEVI